MSKGATVQLVFGFEYAILLTIAFSAFFKFILHSIDLRSEDPWENKSMQVSRSITHVMIIYFRYMLYLDLIVSFSRLLLYATFICIMFKVRKSLKFVCRQIADSYFFFLKTNSDPHAANFRSATDVSCNPHFPKSAFGHCALAPCNQPASSLH